MSIKDLLFCYLKHCDCTGCLQLFCTYIAGVWCVVLDSENYDTQKAGLISSCVLNLLPESKPGECTFPTDMLEQCIDKGL